MSKNTLHTIEDIKNHFLNADTAVYYFISATNFNLMAISDWVKGWFNINFIDCYDKNNSSVFLPDYSETPIFNNIESINQFLLGNKKIVEHIKSSQSRGLETNAMFLFYDKQLEALLESLNMKLIMPPNKLVKHIDNKIITTEIGNSVNVPSVPNALVKIENYSQLQQAIEKYNLSSDVVVQTAYGDSGKTTFFISNEKDYYSVSEKIEAENKVKVMKKIECLQVAMEACATRNGTYVGPILTEIIGHPDLTPYKGGWCGNDVNPYAFDSKTQDTMYHYTEKLGKALYEKGYRGYFEVDYLIDVADKNNPEVFLGELNPRVTGISALTNMSAFCNQTIPLFLFHLLEFSDTNFDLDSQSYNQKVKEFSHSEFSQLIFKHTDNVMKIITDTPVTGVYKVFGTELKFIRYADNPRNLNEDELFILRILSKGEYVYKGADIVILFANKQLQTADNNLTETALNFISVIKGAVKLRVLTDEEEQLSKRYASRASLKTSAHEE